MEIQTPGQVERYRGFVLIPEDDLSWQVRPERSPMHVLPFRTPACSIADVKAARNAHMPCILVRGGYTNTAPELLGADVVIDSFDHLFTALEQLVA